MSDTRTDDRYNDLTPRENLPSSSLPTGYQNKTPPKYRPGGRGPLKRYKNGPAK